VPRFLSIVLKVRLMIYSIPLSLHNDMQRNSPRPVQRWTKPTLINIFIRIIFIRSHIQLRYTSGLYFKSRGNNRCRMCCYAKRIADASCSVCLPKIEILQPGALNLENFSFVFIILHTRRVLFFLFCRKKYFLFNKISMLTFSNSNKFYFPESNFYA